ncbi:MAG: transglycosylase SLT domain-containing protein [Myxococcales bacterium]|nr:transglycosylase SLT domain-containing protein [Myxococcales bacterium]
MGSLAAAPLFLRSALVTASLLCATTSFARELPLRFSPQLPVSAAMADRVRFWVDVFTRVSHTEAVLHDRADPTIIYDVVPYGRGGDTTLIDATRASYEQVLSALATDSIFPSLSVTSPERARVQAMFGVRAGAAAYVRAIGNIRAQRGMREPFVDGLARAELYLPDIRRIFREAKLPSELAYLPHVESSFNPSAVSRAGAAGLWQFTRETFALYDKAGGNADARFDPVRSTEVAVRHLERARNVLGSWPLAIASYNHGVAGMARARSAVGADALDDIVRGYEGATFGFASQNFYAEALAAAHVARNVRHYFPDMPRPPVMRYVVRPGDSLWTIARRHKVSIRDLTAANNLDGSRLKTGQMIVIKTS